jgi:hypothetical protein
MKLKITSALLALAASSFAATVSFSSVGANYDGTDDWGVVLSDGNPISPSSGMARIGYFTTFTDSEVSAYAVAQDYATLFATGTFTTITSDDFTGIATAYGATAGFVSASTSGYNAAGLNKTLYAYFTSGTELGLFKTTSTIVADPAQPTPENTYLLSFADGVAIIGAFGADYVVPTYGPANGTNVSVNSFQLVPEPSATLLGALGALGLLRRRRI